MFTMSIELLEERKRAIVEKFGPWTAHNIVLAPGFSTMELDNAADSGKLQRCIQLIADTAGRPFFTLRILDLACLEGMYAIECGRHGAEAVGIEVREQHLAKASFARDALGLENVQFVQDDVRNLSKEAHGEFDTVLCLGIFYHLDAQDLVPFLCRMNDVCTGFALIDTHIALNPEESFEYDGVTYYGKYYTEHDHGMTPEERRRRGWASLDNERSFWFTRDSLVLALRNAGFSSVTESLFPYIPLQQPDRFMFIAHKGVRQNLLTAPPNWEQLHTTFHTPLWRGEQSNESPITS